MHLQCALGIPALMDELDRDPPNLGSGAKSAPHLTI
jgi:hypothetical protein